MKNKILVPLSILLFSVGVHASEVDGSAIIGSMLGAGVGSAVGAMTGGKEGAIIGGGLGGALGAAAATSHQNSSRSVVYDRDSRPVRVVTVVHENDRYYDEPIEYNRQHRYHRDAYYYHRDDRRDYYRDRDYRDHDHHRDEHRDHHDD
jgi:hypothetical protein